MPDWVAIAHVFSRLPLVALATPMFWLFLTHFPTHGAIDRSPVVRGFVVFSLVAAGGLFGLNVLGSLPSAPRSVVELAAWVDPDPGAGLFWAVGSLLTIPALVYLGIKLRASTGAERRRLALFVSAVAAGLAPMLLDVLLSGVPAYASYFANRERQVQRAAVIMAFALLLPLSTAYVVTVGRVFDLRFYVRKAIQYLLARSTVWAAIAVPVVALLVFIWSRRDQALAEVLMGAPPTMWFVTVTAISLLAVRRRMFDALDRRFFREHYDARTILGGLVERIGGVSTLAELSNLVLEDIDRALHVDSAILFAATPTALSPLSPGYRELPLDGSLARLLAGSAAPLEVDLRPDRSALSRIPPPNGSGSHRHRRSCWFP